MLSLSLPFLLLAFSATALSHSAHGASSWSVEQFESFIVFGDSYTDESRLGYFISHNGSAPPPGTLLPESFSAADGGRVWPRYVIQYTGETVNGEWDPHMTLYNYAVSGAVCSNEITPRPFTLINADFPSVVDYEIPAFLADAHADLINTTQPFYEPPLNDTNAVYAMFIGTNDLGNIAFLTDSQVPGQVLSDYTDCVYGAFDSLYAAGGRFFILMNTVPLYLAPQYANNSLHGVAASQYYPDKGPNHTEIAYNMHQETTSVNDIFKYQTPYEVLVANRYPDAHFAVFDTWQLFSDIFDHSAAFLNGTPPLIVEGFEHHCNLTGGDCVYEYNNTKPDSFMWYDELHPSEQTERVLAMNIVDVLNGSSKYATYWG